MYEVSVSSLAVNRAQLTFQDKRTTTRSIGAKGQPKTLVPQEKIHESEGQDASSEGSVKLVKEDHLGDWVPKSKSAS